MKIPIFTIPIFITVAIIYLLAHQSYMNTEKINFTTSDNKIIVANLFSVNNPKGWLLLSHMMPATKESWDEFAREMQKLGYESLAIDLRGHGESIIEESEKGKAKRLDYRNFSDAEHQASVNDLEAGWEFLQSRGATPEKTVVIGASIGANLSLQFMALHQDISGGVLLSPGNYKGIDSAELVRELRENQKMVFVASKLDERAGGNNAEDNKRYFDLASQVKNRHLIMFDGAGHGTDLFVLKEEYDLTEAIKKFLGHGTIN